MGHLVGHQGAAAARVVGPAEHPGLDERAVDDQLAAALEQVETEEAGMAFPDRIVKREVKGRGAGTWAVWASWAAMTAPGSAVTMRRNCRQLLSVCRSGAGGIRWRWRIRRIVEAPTRWPTDCWPGWRIAG